MLYKNSFQILLIIFTVLVFEHKMTISNKYNFFSDLTGTSLKLLHCNSTLLAVSTYLFAFFILSFYIH